MSLCMTRLYMQLFIVILTVYTCYHVHADQAGPDGSFTSTGASNLKVPDSNPGRADIVIVAVHIQCSKLFKGIECK